MTTFQTAKDSVPTVIFDTNQPRIFEKRSISQHQITSFRIKLPYTDCGKPPKP
jgi:hypothetical protein